MKRLKITRRLGCLILVGLALTAFGSPHTFADETGQENALKTQVSEAKNQYEAAQQQLKELQAEQEQTQQQIANLQQQSSDVQAQLELCYTGLENARSTVAVAQQAQADAENALNLKQAEYDEAWRKTKELMAAMQQMHDRGGIALLSQATNLYELLTFSTTLQNITDKCDHNLTSLSEQATELEVQRQQATEAATAAQAAVDALDAQQAQLDVAVQQLAQYLQSADETMDDQQAAAQAQQQVTEEAKKAYERATSELDTYVRSQSQKYTTADLYCSLDFRCPLDVYNFISTNFGDPDPIGKPHNGTDFAASGGTLIHAAADGVISAANWNNSYGNYVQISHGTADDGNSYDTLYAHMTNYCVAAGQTVSKGDVIGYVGSTGFSTGNHLHLELRINGSRTNPRGYIPS